MIRVLDLKYFEHAQSFAFDGTMCFCAAAGGAAHAGRAGCYVCPCGGPLTCRRCVISRRRQRHHHHIDRRRRQWLSCRLRRRFWQRDVGLPEADVNGSCELGSNLSTEPAMMAIRASEVD
jgi:hypothetical protein